MSTRSTSRARTMSGLAIVALVLLCVLGVRPVEAGDVTPARTAWESGRTEEARGLLRAFLLGDPTDAADLLDAADLAAALQDLDLLERVQGRAEIAAQAEEDPRLDLALGIAYLSIAEIRLSTGVSSPTIAFLFSDAEDLARRVAEGNPGGRLESEARTLWARTRRAVGDPDGALAALSTDATWPGKSHLEGVLRYERAIAKGLDADGRPMAEGTRDLEAALGLLADATDADAVLMRAWAAHRLGALDAARDSYLQAWEAAPASPLPPRGLQSLYANRPAELVAALTTFLERLPEHRPALDTLAAAYEAAGDATNALLTLQRRIAVDDADAGAYLLGGRLFFAMAQWREAEKHLVKALQLDPERLVASRLLEQTAQRLLADEPARALDIYRELATLRPKDPVIWNNFGFVLREVVSPWTTMLQGGVQRLKDDAPAEAHRLLDECVEVYRTAAFLVPEDVSALDERRVWILAGIVNDYGLMLHYFQDVQDLLGAERQYLRALRMTDYGYKDTYVPNLRRLYGLEMPGRELEWYRVAREARYAQLAEVPREDGGFDLVPDEDRRALAARDARALARRIVEELEEAADQDGDPWPPEGPDGGAGAGGETGDG